MLLGNITPPLIVAGAIGLDDGETAFLLQMALFVAGISTLVQSYPVGPVGGRIPVVMGTSFAFVAGAIAIGRSAGLGTVLGACLVASVVEVAIGAVYPRVKRFFPPLVTGIVVMLIGLTLVPVGIDYAAGGVGAADYGDPVHLALAVLVLVVTIGVHQASRGFLSHASVLVGVAVGCGAATALGRLDVSGAASASWFELPRLLPTELSFDLAAILTFAFVYVVSTLETVGDITGTLAAVDREPTDREMSGGLIADGVMSGIATLFGTLPNTSYSQNVGLVNFTGVASRHVTAWSGGFLVVMGLMPKVAAVFAAIPKAVIGGAGLVMFGMIFASGALIVQRGVVLDRRSMAILAVGIGLGLGVELRPAALAQLPEGLATFLGSGLVTGGLGAMLLEAVLPRR